MQNRANKCIHERILVGTAPSPIRFKFEWERLQIHRSQLSNRSPTPFVFACCCRYRFVYDCCSAFVTAIGATDVFVFLIIVAADVLNFAHKTLKVVLYAILSDSQYSSSSVFYEIAMSQLCTVLQSNSLCIFQIADEWERITIISVHTNPARSVYVAHLNRKALTSFASSPKHNR